MQIVEGKYTKAADPGQFIYFPAFPKAGILHTQHLTGEKRLRRVMDD